MTDTSTCRHMMSGRVTRSWARGRSALREDPERIRSLEVERVLRKLDLSGEQAEAVKHLSRSLVDELIHGPITKVIDIVEE